MLFNVLNFAVLLIWVLSMIFESACANAVKLGVKDDIERDVKKHECVVKGAP